MKLVFRDRTKIRSLGTIPNFMTERSRSGAERPFSELWENSRSFSESALGIEIPFSEYEIPFSEWPLKIDLINTKLSGTGVSEELVGDDSRELPRTVPERFSFAPAFYGAFFQECGKWSPQGPGQKRTNGTEPEAPDREAPPI